MPGEGLESHVKGEELGTRTRFSRQPPKGDKEQKAMLGTEARKRKLVFVRYVDHASFTNFPSEDAQPTVRETIGWLVKENEFYLTIIWNRRSSSMPIIGAKERDSGISIVKSLVLEMKEVGV